MDAFVISSLPSLRRSPANGRAPSLHGRYSASSLLRTQPPPSRLRPTSRFRRLYGLPCSGDFSPGRRRASPVARHVLVTVLSLPPRRSVGAASIRFRLRMLPSPSGWGLGLRGYSLSRPLLRSLLLRPGDSSSPAVALSIGFRVLVSRHPAIQATGLLIVAPAGLSPAEHASLRWTHSRVLRVSPDTTGCISASSPANPPFSMA